MKLDIEALAREAGLLIAEPQFAERSHDGFNIRRVATHVEYRIDPKLAAYTNAVLEAAARECEAVSAEWQESSADAGYTPDKASDCAEAIRALKISAAKP